MREYLQIVLLTLAITPSGALSPGPLSAAAVAAGASLGPLGGLLLAIGHTIVEVPYVAVIHRLSAASKGLIERLRIPLNVAMMIVLLYYSLLLLLDAIKIFKGEAQGVGARSAGSYAEALLLGIALTGLNAHFLAWWLTIGYALIESATKHGLKGMTIMYLSHVWMDYAWLTLLAAGGGATELIGREAYAALLALLSLVLFLFFIKILRETVSMIRPRLGPS